VRNLDINRLASYRHAKSTRKRYEGAVGTYFFEAEEKPFLKHVKKNQDTIVDLGCGTGRIFNALKMHSKRIIGVDISTEMLAEAKKSHPEAELYQADFNDIPLPENTADVVICLGTFHLTEQHQIPFREITRVLKTGGSFVFTLWNRKPWLHHRLFHGKDAVAYQRSLILKLLADNGLRLEHIETVFHFPSNLIWPIYKRLPTRLGALYLKLIIHFNKLASKISFMQSSGGEFIVSARFTE